MQRQSFVRAVQGEEDTEEQYFPVKTEHHAVDLQHLEPEQRKQLKQLVDPELFQEGPAFTTRVQHDIILRQDTLAKQKSIPERMIRVLKDELDTMKDQGIIDASDSEWCSPVVLVPIKRCCSPIFV